MSKKVRFVSSGRKFDEVIQILDGHGVTVVPVRKRLTELQIVDVKPLLTNKIIQAFKLTGRPVFVEHTGLYLEALNDLPGGLTRPFWEGLEAARFCKLFGGSRVTAKTVVAYCDSRSIHDFITGEAEGRIADEPAGDRGFGWDCVFIPDVPGTGQTYAELGADKDEVSMRRRALDAFGKYLTELE